MRYEHAEQIALALGIPEPEAPPIIEAAGVTRWRKVGAGRAKLGLLIAQDAAYVTVSDPRPELGIAFVVRHRTATLRPMRTPEGNVIQNSNNGHRRGSYAVNLDAVRSALRSAVAVLESMERPT